MSNENPDSGFSPMGQDDSGDIRRKLVWRMGIAGLMIAILLGGLAVFDHLAIRSEEPESELPRFTEPVPVGRTPEPPSLPAESSGPVLPAPVPEEGPDQPGVPEASALPAAPAGRASPDVVPPAEATPVPSTVPSPTPVPSPAPVPTSSQRTRAPQRAAPAPPAAAPEAARQRGGTETPAPPGAKTAAETQTRSVVIPGGQRRQPLPRRLLSGYTLQAGVFTDPRRAEDVRARLAQEGIPVTLETRVLVGPFKDQKEADSARAKMKAMGIEALLVPREGRK